LRHRPWRRSRTHPAVAEEFCFAAEQKLATVVDRTLGSDEEEKTRVGRRARPPTQLQLVRSRSHRHGGRLRCSPIWTRKRCRRVDRDRGRCRILADRQSGYGRGANCPLCSDAAAAPRVAQLDQGSSRSLLAEAARATPCRLAPEVSLRWRSPSGHRSRGARISRRRRSKHHVRAACGTYRRDQTRAPFHLPF
jgi:hypothetical protein